ncbi:MAG: 16S rRNA (cytosine(1402)-N(4))-methyltransferase RsmH [Deltaproteobacteria bacterium]|nr:16S rRNA (cytosine(1402)-N(4))-methyltransferase RsmH [Deltaproteobacteria bacterium]
MAGSDYHRPVLLDESLASLALRPGSRVVDGTVGGGGHAEAILQAIAPSGSLIGLDVDEEALEACAARLACFGDRVHLERASFRELGRVLEARGVTRVDAVLLDLGVSSRQLDAPQRGFRFAEESADVTALDMRMDARSPDTAARLLAEAPPAELERWFREYGELPGARRLAEAIVEARRTAPLRTARDLLAVVARARVGGGRRHHPATLVFQALRIAVNDELAALEEGLEAAIEALAPRGRLVVIAYHSLEDRIVKERLRAEARGCVCPPRQPVCTCGRRPRLRLLTRRAVRPSEHEVHSNPRARSARLRAAERLADPSGAGRLRAESEAA